MIFAHREHHSLQGISILPAVPDPQPGQQILHRRSFAGIRGAELPRRFYLVIVIGHRKPGGGVQTRMRCRGGIRRIALDKPPQRRLVLCPRHRRKVQQHGKRHHHIRRGHVVAVDMKHRIGQFRRIILCRIGPQLLVIFIDRLGDHVKMHPLGSFGFLIHEIRQGF